MVKGSIPVTLPNVDSVLNSLGGVCKINSRTPCMAAINLIPAVICSHSLIARFAIIDLYNIAFISVSINEGNDIVMLMAQVHIIVNI